MTQMTHPTTKGGIRQIEIPIGKKKLTSKLCTTRPNTDFESNPRSRYFFIRTYLPYDAFVQLFPSCKAWAYIKHDQDNKQEHHHLLLAFDNARFLVSIASDIYKLAHAFPVDGQPQASYIEIPQSLPHCFAYLTHSDPASVKAEKHRYSDTEVVGENLSVFGSPNSACGKVNVVDVLDDINKGVAFREMARKYGTYFVCNFTRFRDYAWNMERQETPEDDITDELQQAYHQLDYFKLIEICIDRLAYESIVFPKYNYREREARSDAIESLLDGAFSLYCRKIDDYQRMRHKAEAEQDLQRLCVAGTEIKEA